MPSSVIAGIDSENQVRLEVEIQGLYKSIPYGAIVDTGYSGGIVLPLITAVDLGLEKVGSCSVALADGSIHVMPTFLCTVVLNGKENEISTLVMGTDVLLGMELLDPYTLCISPSEGKVTINTIEPSIAYNHLISSLRKLVGN